MSTRGPETARLRYWALGVYDVEAAVDLYLDCGLGARLGVPEGGIDFTALLHQWQDLLSGGERRMLSICASLTDAQFTVSLSEVLTSLDQRNQQLVLTALAHAMGQRPPGWVRPHEPERAGR